LTAREPTGRVARWVIKLRDLDFTIRHRPGTQMQLPDMLSRQPQVAALEAIGIKEAQRRDALLGPMITALENGEEPKSAEVLKAYKKVADKLILQDGELVFFDGSKKTNNGGGYFRDAMIGGHLGIEKTFKRVQERFWWPNLYTNVEHYVSTCETCARAKKPKRSVSGAWEATVVGAPWQRVAVDHLLVFTDYFTRYVVAVPTKDCGAESTAKQFVEKIVLQHGAPEELQSDQGPAFVGKVVEHTCAMAGTKKMFTTAYRPQANGMVERWNGTVAQMLTAYMDENEKDWDEKVPYVAFAYNTAQHATTKYTPFELVHGRKARLPIEVVTGARRQEKRSTIEYANEQLVQMQEGYRAAREMADNSKRTQERRKLQEGGGVGRAEYAEGDKVWLDKRPAGDKFSKKFDGPYEIVEVHGENYVTIALEDGEQVKVHVERVKPHKERASEDKTEEKVDKDAEDGDTSVDEEPIKEVARKPNTDKLLPNDLIGKRVRVYWSGDKAWYDGLVVNRKRRLHVIKYDDGEVKAERLLGYSKGMFPEWELLERRRSGASSL